MSSPKKFAMQGALDVLFLGGADNTVPEAFIEDAQTTGLTFEATKVYNLGKGGAYLVGFSHSRRITSEIVNGYLSTEVMAMQAGNSIVVGANTNAIKYEYLTINTNSCVTTFTALGTVGEEIGTIYTVNSDGSFSTPLTQAGTPSATEFSYTVGTRTIATSGLADGTRVFVVYRHTTDATAQTIDFDADKFAGNKKVIYTGLAKSLCGGDKLYKAQIIMPKADIGDNFTLNFEETGDPTVQNISIEALADICGGTNNMVQFILFDENLAS